MTLRVLHANLTSVHRFADEFPSFGPAEVHAASLRLRSLLKAQSAAIDDLAAYTGEELKFGKERIADLSAQVLQDEQAAAGAAVNGYRAMYVLLHSTATILCAEHGYLLLFDRNPHVASMRPLRPTAAASPPEAVQPPTASSPAAAADLFDSPLPGTDRPRATSPTGTAPSKLVLTAHVTASVLGASAPSAIPDSVHKVCEAVASTCSSVNIVVRTAPPGTPACDRSIVAVPLRVPGLETACCGVVVFTGKLTAANASVGAVQSDGSLAKSAPPRTLSNLVAPSQVAALLRRFTNEDEVRCSVVAEQLAVMVTALPVGVANTGSVAVTATTFQTDLARWRHSTRAAPGSSQPPRVLGAVDSHQHAAVELVTGTAPRRFILRTDVSASAIHNILSLPSRQVVSGGTLLADLTERLAAAEKALEETTAGAKAAERRVTETERELADVRTQLRVSERDAGDMRAACERVLRVTMLDRDAGASLASPSMMAESLIPASPASLLIPGPPAARSFVGSANYRAIASTGRAVAHTPASPRRPNTSEPGSD
jgi:hypothetical protein